MPHLPAPLRNALSRHKARHTPTGFEFLLSDRIGFIPHHAWDALTSPASVFLSRRYLEVIERAGPTNLTPRYAMVFSDGQPAAAVVAQSVTVTPDRLKKPSERVGAKVLRRVAAAGLGGLEQRLLICGNLLSWGCHGIAIAPGHEGPEIWSGIAEALYRIRRADKLAGETDLIMIKDITQAECDDAAALKAFSYRRLETDPNMVLELNPAWKSYDDYLGALTSKYRKAARDIDKDLAAAGFSVESIAITAENAQELHALYMQVHERAKTRLFTLTPEFLPTLAAAYGEEFRCSAIRRGEQILGFVTSLKDHDTSIAYYVGFDSAANEEAPLYFKLLLRAVEDAIALGCSRVSFGRTALEPKAKLGAKPAPMEVWIRHRVPALNLLVRAALRGVHHDDAPERNPFK